MRAPRATTAVFLAAAILFSLMTVALQVRALGVSYLESGEQWTRHKGVLQGTAIDPWQYRILSDYLAEGVIRSAEQFGVPHPIATGFIVFRLVQNVLLFWLASLYYRTLGLDSYLTLLGLSCLAWGLTNAYYESDLQFSTYSEVIFYLLAALIILRWKLLWIPVVVVLASLNRETSLLIPFLIFAEPGPRTSGSGSRKAVAVSVASFALALAILIGLREFYGPRPTGLSPPPGAAMLLYNVTRYHSWLFLLATMGPLPIMAFVSLRGLPRTLRIWFWTLVPIWLAVHLFASVIAETRLFLVPHALIFVPGALLGADVWRQKTGAPG